MFCVVCGDLNVFFWCEKLQRTVRNVPYLPVRKPEFYIGLLSFFCKCGQLVLQLTTCWSWHKLMWKWMTFSDQPSKSAFPKWSFQKRMLGLHLSDGLFWALLTTASMGWRELCFHTVWCVHHVLICSAHMGTSPLSCHGPGILCDLQLFLFGGCFPTVNQWADLPEFQAF